MALNTLWPEHDLERADPTSLHHLDQVTATRSPGPPPQGRKSDTITAATLIGIDVSRDELDGVCLPFGVRFRLPNSAQGHARLAQMIQALPAPSKIDLNATEGQEWALWTPRVQAGEDAVPLPPAQIKAVALSWRRRATTDRIDAELIARFMAFRPEAGRRLPSEILRVLRALTTRRAQIVEMRHAAHGLDRRADETGRRRRRGDHG